MKRFLEALEKILLFLFVLLIPTQLGKHFWPEWSRVVGIRVDYLSPTLYFLDLVWLGLFLITNCQLLITDCKKRRRKTKKKGKAKNSWIIMLQLNVETNKLLSTYKKIDEVGKTVINSSQD